MPEGKLGVEVGHGSGGLESAVVLFRLSHLPSTTHLSSFALAPLETVTRVCQRLNLWTNNKPVKNVGQHACDDQESLPALLDLVPMRRLEWRAQQHRVEVEVGEEQGRSEERRSGKVRGLESLLEGAEGLLGESGELLVA